MKTAFGRFLPSFVLVASTLLYPACDKIKSPTEPVGAVVRTTSTPTPIQTPTPIPQPASMSGVVDSYGGVLAGVTVECQGRSAITSSDGTYSLTGLMSGTTTAKVSGAAVGSYPLEYPIELKPGSNTVNLLVY